MSPITDRPEAAAPAVPPRWRLFYWSLRRELWEHRSIWIAPLAVAVVALAGALFSTIGLPHTVREAATLAGARKAGAAIETPYDFIAFAVVMTGLIVGLFYSLGALHGERRDRSILFWKSLPVSDPTTVLAKAAVPILVLPVIEFAVILAAHTVKLAFSALVVAASGEDLGVWWAHVPVPEIWRMLADGLPFIALWYAPLYAWLILVSAWARRIPYLWAIAPPLLLGLVERLALGTHAVWSWLALRVIGAFLGVAPHKTAAQFDPVTWGSPHLWIGLALAAAFLAAAVRLRRSGDPF
jgi:ABC-2 type transport system permease protein